MNKHADRIDRDLQSLGDLLVATIFHAVQAESLGLPGCNAARRLAQLAGEFRVLEILRRGWQAVLDLKQLGGR